MEDSSFENEFFDVIASGVVPLTKEKTRVVGKGMSSFLYEEIQKQLEQTCFEISSWFGAVLQETLSTSIMTSLRDGTVLCRSATILYQQQSISQWIECPEEYMDNNVNIAIFGDHCLALGIDQSMIIDYTMFDDNDLAHLTTCLLEYIDCYNSRLVNHTPVTVSGTEDKQTDDEVFTIPNVNSTAKKLPDIDEVIDRGIKEVLLPSEHANISDDKCCYCCCFI